MERRSLKRITWGVITLTVLIVILMLGGTLHRTSHITLPAPDTAAEPEEKDPAASGSALMVVEVTPATVQSAIETLARPEQYRRSVTIEQFWNGGSGIYEVQVAVSVPWTRTDRTMPDGRVRHTVTGEGTTYVWYNSDEKIYTAPAGEITADNEQSIPTYEDILSLPVESIITADYRAISSLNCIYVETAEDLDGYALRYWVDVDTGLLVASERLLDGSPVYRMSAPDLDQAALTEADFTLPDGRVLS